MRAELAGITAALLPLVAKISKSSAVVRPEESETLPQNEFRTKERRRGPTSPRARGTSLAPGSSRLYSPRAEGASSRASSRNDYVFIEPWEHRALSEPPEYSPRFEPGQKRGGLSRRPLNTNVPAMEKSQPVQSEVTPLKAEKLQTGLKKNEEAMARMPAQPFTRQPPLRGEAAGNPSLAHSAFGVSKFQLGQEQTATGGMERVPSRPVAIPNNDVDDTRLVHTAIALRTGEQASAVSILSPRLAARIEAEACYPSLAALAANSGQRGVDGRYDGPSVGSNVKQRADRRDVAPARADLNTTFSLYESHLSLPMSEGTVKWQERPSLLSPRDDWKVHDNNEEFGTVYVHKSVGLQQGHVPQSPTSLNESNGIIKQLYRSGGSGAESRPPTLLRSRSRMPMDVSAIHYSRDGGGGASLLGSIVPTEPSTTQTIGTRR